MKCIKCNIDIDDPEMEGFGNLNIICVNCYNSDSASKNRENNREDIISKFNTSIDDYIELMSEERIELILLNSDIMNSIPGFNASNSSNFKHSVKRLYDIDYEDVLKNGADWVLSKIREKNINRVLNIDLEKNGENY